MSDPKTAFSYANIIKNLPFIAFIRTKTAKGKYSYEFPSVQDREYFDFSPFDEILTDTDGCLDIVYWGDKEKLARAIEKSEREMTVSQESFCVILSSGEKRWLAGSAFPKKQKNGDIVWKGFWLDVTHEKKKDYFNSLVLESVHEGIVAFDRQGHILSFSPSLMNILSCSSEDAAEKTIFSLLPLDVSETLQQYMLLSALKEKIAIQVSLPKEDGQTVFLEIDMMQKDSLFVCLFRDVTKYRQREDELLFLAYHDVNTGVENYTYLKDAFAQALDQSKVSQTQIAVLSIKLDSVGQLNAISDQEIKARVIAAMAERIRSCLSQNDYLAQVSNDSFTVLATGLEFTLGIERKIEAILHSFDRSIFVDELEFDLSVSSGVCFCPQDGNG